MADNDPISLAEFLETIPPSQTRTIQAKFRAERRQRGDQTFLRLEIAWPEIQLHCTHTNCNGIRFFQPSEGTIVIINDEAASADFVTYTCRNCRQTARLFAVFTNAISETQPDGKPAKIRIEFAKIGEVPPFGPFTSPRLITLIGPDREVFLKGRRAENQGLGIGAFAYYRRVVEDQKGRIIEKIADAASQIGAPQEMIDTLTAARMETQFSRAIEIIKEGIPDSLKIRGHNPLTLLHSALSEGLHARTDEECLELAQDIRLVLTELADRVSQAVKDDRELNEAVTRLLKRGRSGAGEA
jgi:hypothetical protein